MTTPPPPTVPHALPPQATPPAPPAGPSPVVKVGVAAVIGLIVLCPALVFILIGYGPGFATGEGLFGTRASLFADINLILEIILLLGLTFGYGLAKAGKISAHQYNQTAWVFFNIVLVIFIMAVSFTRSVASGIPERLLRPYYASSFIHSLLGTLTIVCAVYILLRMNRLLPKFLRISWWKNLMRITLGLYWLVGLFGIGTYIVWYVLPRDEVAVPEVGDVAAGTAIVPVANYAFNPGVLEIPVGTTVIFRNDDPDPHTVTSETGAFPEGIIEETQEYTFTFDTLGDFPYYCLYHGAEGGVGMAGIVRVLEADQVAAIPTAVAPPVPTAQPTAAEPPAEPLGPQSVGFGAFSDSEARSDTFTLHVAGLPATTNEYHAWLTGAGGNQHLGALAPDAQGSAALTFVSPTGENLLARFSGFVVTVETAGAAPSAPSAQVVVGSSLAPEVLGPIQQMLVASADAPETTPYALGLIHLSEELYRHAKAVNGAALLGDFDGMNRHIEHMLTIVQGQGGEHYRDFDNDGAIQDPGDGYGILRYADGVAAQALAAGASPGATDNVRVHAAELQVLAANMRQWGNQVVDLVILAHQATAAADQQTYAGEALATTRHMLDGVDANGNGEIEAVAGEGGAYTTYFSAQYLAALGALPEEGSGVATPAPATATPEPTIESTPEPTTAGETDAAPGPTATPEPPTATVPPQPTATPAPVFITYFNFGIDPASTTIKVGTTVTFLIRDSLHQPYNFTAPNTFEAPANLGDGQSYQHTFTEAGTITILCGYHANMSAQLVIQP